jgi:pyruvyl transferase EpsO
MRDDEERLGNSVTGYDIRLDWRELVGPGNKYRIRIARGVLRGLYLARVKREHLASQLDLWIDYAERLVGDAVDLFSKFDVITTDRLHAHILACLMGIPNTVLNNSYGKNYSYVDAWTGVSDIVHFDKPDC